jgi:DNA-binding transcriptional ArsR family regulator
MITKKKFDAETLELSKFIKAISHPARLTILKYLAETKTCISGDISNYLPLSRSTVFQHLAELKELGLIHGEIEGLKVNYCLCNSSIVKNLDMFDKYFSNIRTSDIQCDIKH